MSEENYSIKKDIRIIIPKNLDAMEFAHLLSLWVYPQIVKWNKANSPAAELLIAYQQWLETAQILQFLNGKKELT